jgi:hypothetical protein
MVDQNLLNDTLQKINASLNKRFEKDADLYISKQDEYEIKKHLCNEAYGAVVDMAKAKGISHDIIVKVIMRNAGVLDVKDIGKFKRELKPILEDANYKTLQYMMENVLGNTVYMQKKIRHILFSYYMNGITATLRLDYWKCGTFDFKKEERAELFKLILQKTNDETKILKFKWDFSIDAFNRFPSILEDKEVLIKLKNTLSEADKAEFFKYLSKEMENSKDNAYDFVLIEAYASYGAEAFNDAVNNIKASSAPNYKKYVRAICTLFWDEKDKDTLNKMFNTMIKVYDSPYLKRHIKREINKKVWKSASENKVLYENRKADIDSLLKNVEKTDKNKYQSFSDIASDMRNNTPPKSISFFWVNIESPAFEQSVLESFTKMDSEYLSRMKDAYSWLFEHSHRKGNVKGLKKMCEKLAQPLHEFATSGIKSDFFDFLDSLWVNNVVTYKLQGPKIEDYMLSERHHDKVKEWQ